MNPSSLSPETLVLILVVIATLLTVSLVMHLVAGIRLRKQKTEATNVDVPTPAQVFAAKTPALTVRPEIGTDVVLLKEDSFLREYCDAVPGTTGTIVAHSALHGPDRDTDQGVLVLWTSSPIDSVRIELDEIALV